MRQQWKQWETFFSWAPKITADGDCSHEIKESVIVNGGNYASGVNKKLDLLIVGEAAGESKLKKANELEYNTVFLFYFIF